MLVGAMTVHPRLVLGEVVPLHKSNSEPGRSQALWRAYLVFGAVAVIGIILALTADGVPFAVSMVSVSVFTGLFIPYARALTAAVSPGRVRVVRDAELTFLAPLSTTVFPIVLSLVALVPVALAIAVPGAAGVLIGRGPQGVWVVVLAGAAVVWLVQTLWGLRLPRGLALTAWGLEGVRGGPAVRLPWDFVAAVSAVPGSRGARLLVQPIEGRALLVQGADLGSDPNVVAAIIEHFRTHPEDDHRLANAMDAIRCVEDAQRARE